MAQTSLPPGFRFHPTDVELCSYYLKRKIMGKKLLVEAISEVELYKYAPWDLPDKSCLQSRDMEWYFFCPRDKKYANGPRTNRSTPNGYWKATGKDRTIVLNTRIVGMKKTLIFHEGKPPRGDRTDWVMYEYRMEDDELDVSGFSKDAYVLCKIFKKSGRGPRIGEQYGATFNEEEWDNVNNETSMLHLMSCPSSKVMGAANGPPVLHTVSSTSNVVTEPHILSVPSAEWDNVNNEKSMFHLMSCPSSKVMGVASGRPVLHTVSSTSNVVKEPHILSVPSADGLPSKLTTSSTTAIDEPHCYTRCNESGMVTVDCASNALDACDPNEFGGTSSEETNEWVQFLCMDNDGGASEKLSGLPAISEVEAQALETNSDYCYHELVRLAEAGGVSTLSNLLPAYGNTEYLNPLLVSGIGTSDNYLEINDIFPLGETVSFNLSPPGNLFTQYPLEQFPCSELNRPQYDNDCALSASLVAGDFFAPISCSMHDTSVHRFCTTNCVLNDSSNSTMQYPFS